MKNRSAILFFLLIVLALPMSVRAQTNQNNVLDQIAAKLITDIRNDQREVIFAHVDKPIYLAGGTLWFRVFLLNSPAQTINNTSKLVYVDLVNATDSVVQQLILNARELQLQGGIRLAGELPEGEYYLKAYTANLLQTNPAGIFVYPFYLLNNHYTSFNKADSVYSSSKPLTDKPDILFAVEGNHLINGVDNLVGVRAFDVSGKPLLISGYVKDSRDSIVARFAGAANGLGKFTLFPYRGRKYTAIVQASGMRDYVYEFPAISSTAYQLALLGKDSQNLHFRVALGDQLYEKKVTSYLLGVSKDKLVFASIGRGMYEINVPRKDFSQAIASFYLFDEQKQLVSWRKVWIDSSNINVFLSADKKQYYPRSTAKLDISITDKTGKPMIASLSVAVTDDQAIPPAGNKFSPADKAILKTLNRGMAECFFDQKKPGDIDILLLGDDFEKLPARGILNTDTSLIISGKLIYHHEPLVNQPINLVPMQGGNTIKTDTSDASGRFHFTHLDYYDSTLFALQLANSKFDAKEITLELDQLGSPATAAKQLYSGCQNENELQQALQQFKKMAADTFLIGNTREWLQAITVKGVRRTGSEASQKNKFSRMITREQLSKKNLSTTADALKMIPGVIMMNGQLTIRGGMRSLDGGPQTLEPLVIVDGVQASPGGSVVDYLNSIPPEQIESIEVFTGPEAAAYGTRGGNGVIVVKTGLPQYDLKKQANLIGFYPKGYHLSPPFYMPSYDIDKVKEANFKDNRSTIYWNGDILTDANGKASVQFYTADAKTTYTVTIMGITAKGDIINKKITISRN